MQIQLWQGEAPDTAICGNQAQPSLDAYPVEGSKGAIVVCPGGGYGHKAPHEGAPVAKMLNEAGISAYVLDYRVRPFRLETAVGDALRAIRVLKSMGYEKVGILGFSAGGHLAGAAATLYDAGKPDSEDPIERFSSRPDAFVSCYGATSFREFLRGREANGNAWPSRVLGEERVEDNATVDRYSAEMNVTPDTPTGFLWHTADDKVVPVECALRLAAALRAQGVMCEMHIYPHGPHGMGLAQEDPVVGQWTAQAQKWLIGLGFGR